MSVDVLIRHVLWKRIGLLIRSYEVALTVFIEITGDTFV